MRKEILKIQVIQTIFVMIILMVAILEKNNFLERNESIKLFYIISILVFWIILTIIIVVIIKRNETNINFDEKKFGIICILIILELFGAGVFAGIIDNTVDKIEFSTHCKEAMAYIYNIKKDIDVRYIPRTNDDNDTVGIAKFTYYFKYDVGAHTYTGNFYESRETTRTSSSGVAISDAKRIEARHENGEELTIYYNTENPSDYRMSIAYASEKMINIIFVVFIIIRILFLYISIIKYKKEKLKTSQTQTN